LAGLGVVIISPTRELALQTFDVLRNIGKKHSSLSAGLVIGGKDVKVIADERSHSIFEINNANIGGTTTNFCHEHLGLHSR